MKLKQLSTQKRPSVGRFLVVLLYTRHDDGDEEEEDYHEDRHGERLFGRAAGKTFAILPTRHRNKRQGKEHQECCGHYDSRTRAPTRLVEVDPSSEQWKAVKHGATC